MATASGAPSASTDLYLEGLSPKVRVLPVVYFAVLDHYLRRNDVKGRVIGTLLGTVSSGNQIEITNCFPVPHNETDEQVAVDMEYHRTMFDLHQRVNEHEVIVGWYASGHDITEHSTLIHEFYSREQQEHPIVHLLVDTTLKGGRMGVQAAVSSEMGVPGSESRGTVFTPVSVEVVYHEPERLSLELFKKGIAEKTDKLGITSLVNDLDSVSTASKQLQAKLDGVLKYVDSVVAGKTKGDEDIGRLLLDTVTAVPKIDPAQFETMFNSTLQDLLMVVYLANLTRKVDIQEKANEIL